MDSLVLPGEEASTAEVSYDHRQKILVERGDTVSERVTSWVRKTSGGWGQEAGAGAPALTDWVNLLIWCQKVGCKPKKSR